MIILLRVLLIITFFKSFNIKSFNFFYKFIKCMKSFLISITWVLRSLKSYKILSVVCTLLVPIKSLFLSLFHCLYSQKIFIFKKEKFLILSFKNEGKFLSYQNFCCLRWLFRSCIKPSSDRSKSSRSTRLYASVGNGVNSTSTIQNSIILNNENEIGGEENSLNRMEVVPMIRNHTSAPDIRKGRIYYSGLRNWVPWS